MLVLEVELEVLVAGRTGLRAEVDAAAVGLWGRTVKYIALESRPPRAACGETAGEGTFFIVRA